MSEKAEKSAFNPKRYVAESFEDGAWSELDGGEFKIGLNGSARHLDAINRVNKDFEQRHGKDLTGHQVKLKAAQIQAEGLLHDWRNVGSGDDVVPFSIENAVKLIMEYPPLAWHIDQQSTRIAQFERDRIEAETKKP